MNNWNPILHYQQVLSMALEARAPALQDIVGRVNPLFDLLRQKGAWQTYTGPRIRQSLLINLPPGQWAGGYDFLATPPTTVVNDAYYIPKMGYVPISITKEEILGNSGPAQIRAIVATQMEAAEAGLQEFVETAFHSDGTAFDGKEIDGAGAFLPEVPTNVYGGINRATVTEWRTGTYDVQSFAPDIGTAVDATTIQPFMMRVMGNHIRGRNYPDCILFSQDLYEAYHASLMAIQRLGTSEPGTGGWEGLAYRGAGVRATVYYGGGYGTRMPPSTGYFLDSGTIKVRYHRDRNFSPIFDGQGQMPINQDAIVQFLGFMGNITLTNPRGNARMFDGS